MTAIYLLALNFILSLTLSQFVPIDVTTFAELNIVGNSKNCETIGGYNYATDKVHIYGGEDVKGGDDQAKYIFDPTNQVYDYENLTYLTTGNEITIDGDYTQRHGPNADNILYFASGTDIKGIDMNADTTVDTYATKTTQTQPGLCMDDVNNILYSVGNKMIQACSLSKTSPPACIGSATEQRELDKISGSACAFYGGFIYVFGGEHEEAGIIDDIWKCNPLVADSCNNVATLVDRKKAINALIIECFTNNYVALMGGLRGLGTSPTYNSTATGLIEIYDLKTDTLLSRQNTWTMAQERTQFVTVFDPIDEAIFAFGGRGNADPQCLTSVEFSAGGDMGICYTVTPTMDPTVEPTVNPTNNPSITPTNNPSTPTNNPSITPTNNPSTPTNNPSITPTNNPSITPTNNPSITPTNNPSTTPTISPTGNPSASPAKSPGIPPSAEPYKPQTGGFTTKPSSYGIIIVILVLICCIILCCVFWYSREEKDHVYGIMPQDAAVVAGTAVPMAAVVVTYCDSCGKATPCSCGSCGKCGKSTCKNECGQKCNNCGKTECNGRTCR
eukprot:828098_1